MSVRFSFKRTGEIIAAPRVTFATADVPADTRATYLEGDQASLAGCAPLKFTGGLGGALAGRPIAIRYVDNRDLGASRSREGRAAGLGPPSIWRIAFRTPENDTAECQVNQPPRGGTSWD